MLIAAGFPWAYRCFFFVTAPALLASIVLATPELALKQGDGDLVTNFDAQEASSVQQR